MVRLVQTHTSMKQLAGDEQKKKSMKRTILALVKGTDLEQRLAAPGQMKRLFKRVRQDCSSGQESRLIAVPKVVE